MSLSQCLPSPQARQGLIKCPCEADTRGMFCSLRTMCPEIRAVKIRVDQLKCLFQYIVQPGLCICNCDKLPALRLVTRLVTAIWE